MHIKWVECRVSSETSLFHRDLIAFCRDTRPGVIMAIHMSLRVLQETMTPRDKAFFLGQGLYHYQCSTHLPFTHTERTSGIESTILTCTRSARLPSAIWPRSLQWINCAIFFDTFAIASGSEIP